MKFRAIIILLLVIIATSNQILFLEIDDCPYQTGDQCVFIIEGDWIGNDPETSHGDFSQGILTGNLTLDFLIRNRTHLILFEEKFETICGEFNDTNVCLCNNPSSFWFFDPLTRESLLLSTYAWMWVTPNNLQLGKFVTIYNYQFLISERLDIIFENESRSCYRASYGKEATLQNGGTRIFGFNFYFDKLTGHIIEYLVTTETYDQNDVRYDYGNYKMFLYSTSVDLHPGKFFDSFLFAFLFLTFSVLIFYLSNSIRRN